MNRGGVGSEHMRRLLVFLLYGTAALEKALWSAGVKWTHGVLPAISNLDFSISSGWLGSVLEIRASGHEPIEALDHAVLGFMCSQSNLEFPL